MDDLVKRLRKGDPFGGVMQKAADRIAALEAQVRAADALADEARHLRKFAEVYSGKGIDIHKMKFDAALAAYRATKEGGA